MKSTKKALLTLGIISSSLAFSQEKGIVLTGAPFLRIAPDARSGGLADQGVATSTDAFSQFWNAAKYPFSKTSSAVAVSYTPYMSKLTNDVFLLYGAYHTFLDKEERSTLGASIYYFNMGEVELSKLVGKDVVSAGKTTPNELSVDVSYGLKLSDQYSMAVTGRYIRSDFGNFNSDSNLKPANSFAVDLSGFYQSPKFQSFSNFQGQARGGFAIQNLGPKLDYTGDESSRSYLPSMLRIGGGYDLFLDEVNKIGLSVEASRILVPGTEVNEKGVYSIPNVGVIEGIGKSFSNPNATMLSTALEYSYDKSFAVRAGYFTESEKQGARKFATVGVGFNYQSFGLDVSYLINTSKTNSALDNTLRFGLTWNIGNETENATK